MTYIYTRHAEKPHPVSISEKDARWLVERCYGAAHVFSKIQELKDGKVDYIATRDGTITVEKGKDES